MRVVDRTMRESHSHLSCVTVCYSPGNLHSRFNLLHFIVPLRSVEGVKYFYSYELDGYCKFVSVQARPEYYCTMNVRIFHYFETIW